MARTLETWTLARLGVAERAQAARELLVEQAGTVGLARLVGQRQGQAEQLRGAGGVTGRVGRVGAARQQRHSVHAGALLGIRDPVPEREYALELQLGLGEGVHLLGSGGGLDARAQGSWLVAGCRPVVGDARRPRRRSVPRLEAGFQGTGQRGMQVNPLAGEQLAVDRLGDQRVAEDVALAIRLGEQHLLVDRLTQALEQLRLAHAGDRGQHRLGGARTGRGSDTEHQLGARAEPYHPGEQHLLEAGRQRARAGAVAGQHQLLGEERVALGAGVDLLDEPGGRGGTEQAGELLGQLGTAEARQLQALHAAVACQLAEQPAQRVQAVQLVAAEGEQQQHRAGAQVGGEEGDQVAGGAVRPVQVLDDQQQRRAYRQPLDHAEQQLEQPPLAGIHGSGACGRLATPGKVGNQAGQVGAGRAGDRLQLGRIEVPGEAAQRLGDRRERQALLTERHAAAAQHPDALLAGGDSQLVGQPGLANPASPPIAVTSGSPLAARASNSRSSASSSLRPTKRPVMTWYAMTPSMPPAPTVVAMRLRVEVWSTVLRSWPGPAPTTSCCEVASRLARYPPVSTSRTAASFHSVSAHSASGSEPATMPFPVTRRAPPAVRVAQRMATAHSPSPRASTQPTGPA